MRRLAILVAVAACCALPSSASAIPVTSFGFLGKWGGRGSAATQFDHPVGVAIDTRQFVHVVDQGNLRADLFAGGGGFLSIFGKGVNGGTDYEECESGCRAGAPGSGAGELAAQDGDGNPAGPTGIAQLLGMNGPSTYVADTGNDRVTTYAPDGTPTGQFGSGTGSANGFMTHPTGVAVDSTDGSLYVVDQSNKRIDKFANNGTFVAAWGKNVDTTGGTGAEVCPAVDTCKSGESGSGGGEFQKPVDVAVDGSQNVYVTDETGEVVQKFDKDGAFLAMWGKNVDGTGGHTCTASCSGGTFGTAEGDFYYPEGIGIGGDKIYVVDSLNNRVEQFSTAGSFIRTFGWGVSGGSGFEVCTSSCQAGVPGSGGGQFDHPQRVGVDPGGNPYVSDTGNNRIERFGDIHIAHDGSELESMLLACSAYDTILLQPGDYTLSGPSNLGGFVIAPDPATNGNARNITIDAQNSGRAFTVNFGWNSVSGVTIKNGLSHSDGGAIQVQDGRFLYLQDSTVTRNQSVNDGTARTWGGGIFNSGELHTMNVTFSQNTSSGEDVAGHDAFGGAIATAVDTTNAHTYLINTTISGNTANQGEGAVNATAAGGGIYTDGASTTEVYGSTIAGNTVSGAQAGSGGGGNIFDEMPVFDGTYLSDTIVAQGASNRAGSENCAVGSGAMVSRGGNVEDRDQCGLTLASDQKNTNPLLGPLQDNGGPIDTRAIPLTSPAVDRALNGPCNVFDARGSARKTAQDPLCDGGAFEAGSKPSSTGGGERPKCTLKPAGSKVKAPKPRTLKLKVVCDRVAALKLAGKLTLKPKKKKGAKKKPKAKKFSVSTSGNATQAGKQVTLTVKVSKKAIKLLKKKAKGSAAFRLTASNANGSTTTPAKIKKLKLVVKKKKHKKH